MEEHREAALRQAGRACGCRLQGGEHKRQARGRRPRRRDDERAPVGHTGLLHAEGGDRGAGADAGVDAELP